VLSSPALVGEQVLTPSATSRWYMDWSGDVVHPHWLTEAHFDRLAASRACVPAEPVPLRGGPLLHERPERALFARKFSSREPRLLDRIDDHLRS
jgi:hypothetical protein